MLPHNIIKDFINVFKTLDNKIGDVSIKHLLYGNQKINKCILHPLMDGDSIGLVINGENKYISMNEMCEIYIDDQICRIKSDVMELHIML